MYLLPLKWIPVTVKMLSHWQDLNSCHPITFQALAGNIKTNKLSLHRAFRSLRSSSFPPLIHSCVLIWSDGFLDYQLELFQGLVQAIQMDWLAYLEAICYFINILPIVLGSYHLSTGYLSAVRNPRSRDSWHTNYKKSCTTRFLNHNNTQTIHQRL